MRLLVTGGAGFIGSHVLRFLASAYPDYTIVCADTLTYAANYGLIEDIEELSAHNKLQLLVPKGFAHGHATLSDSATALHKADQYYNKNYDTGIHPLSDALTIDWGVVPILSEKDQNLSDYLEFKSMF